MFFLPYTLRSNTDCKHISDTCSCGKLFPISPLEEVPLEWDELVTTVSVFKLLDGAAIIPTACNIFLANANYPAHHLQLLPRLICEKNMEQITPTDERQQEGECEQEQIHVQFGTAIQGGGGGEKRDGGSN